MVMMIVLEGKRKREKGKGKREKWIILRVLF